MAPRSSLLVVLLLTIALLHGTAVGNSMNEDRKLSVMHHSLRSASNEKMEAKHQAAMFPIYLAGRGIKASVIVSPELTIKEVKGLIQRETKIAPGNQILTYRNKPLEDSNTLASYAIKGPTLLEVSVRTRKLSAKLQSYRNAASANGIIPIAVIAPGGKFLPLSLPSQMPVMMIKVMLLSKLPNTGLTPKNMVLKYNGKFLEDTKSLDFYQIGPKAILEMTVKSRKLSGEHQAMQNGLPTVMMLKVKTLSGKTFPVKAVSSMTIGIIKAMIPKPASFPPDKIVLRYMGNELDNRMTLDFYGIKPGATLESNM